MVRVLSFEAISDRQGFDRLLANGGPLPCHIYDGGRSGAGEPHVEVDHSSLNRWVIKYVRLLDQAFRARKR